MRSLIASSTDNILSETEYLEFGFVVRVRVGEICYVFSSYSGRFYMGFRLIRFTDAFF